MWTVLTGAYSYRGMSAEVSLPFTPFHWAAWTWWSLLGWGQQWGLAVLGEGTDSLSHFVVTLMLMLIPVCNSHSQRMPGSLGGGTFKRKILAVFILIISFISGVLEALNSGMNNTDISIYYLPTSAASGLALHLPFSPLPLFLPASSTQQLPTSTPLAAFCSSAQHRELGIGK